MLFSSYVFAQYNYRDSNRIGVFVGMNQFTLITDSFDAKPDTGWNAGLSVRGNFYENWDIVYAIQFSENNFLVATKNLVLLDEDVKYTLPSAQVSLQFSYKIIPDHLSLEFGPIFQLNGKLNIDNEDENNIISGTPLFAKDIVEISKFNFYPVAGITFGVKHVRLNFSYQYGLFNTLGNLSYENLGVNLKGNPGIANGNLIIYF
ncbi:hypothetical protein D3C84_185400 [compost metagenome]